MRTAKSLVWLGLLAGAGATFPAPLYAAWFLERRDAQAEVGVEHEAVGSGTTHAFTSHLGAVSPESSATCGTRTLAAVPLDAHRRAFATDPGGADVHPIVSDTWLLLHRRYESPERAAAVRDPVRWCLTDGQASCERLGYVPLAPNVVAAGLEALEDVGA